MAAHKTALVTGANSGLGFEAAAQLASRGYDRIILATRTAAKGDAARLELVERVGRDPYEVVAIDVGKNGTVRAALGELAERGGAIDFALLNAGMVSGNEVVAADNGVEITVAASLMGHHVLTTGLLERGLLAADARIVIAGSEAARGDVPTFGLTDVPGFADTYFAGDREAAIEAIAKAKSPAVYSKMPQYAMAKVFVAWWAAALARRLPDGMTVNAVSPGSVPNTNAMRNQPWLMRVLASSVMPAVGGLFGLAQTVEVAARRYLDAAELDASHSGEFYCSAPGKMVGAVEVQTQPHLHDEKSQEALYAVVARLTGADLTPVPLREVSMA